MRKVNKEIREKKRSKGYKNEDDKERTETKMKERKKEI